MATEFKHKITTPFAQNGTRTEIPQTSSDGSVSFDQGYTDLYSKKPSEGGKYVGRVPINYLFYLATAALKEIQEIIINGDIDVLKKLQEDIQQGNIPVNMENARNVLSVENGGTGQNSLDNLKNVTLLPNDFNGTILDFFNMLPERYGATYVGLSHATKGRITDLPSTSKEGVLTIYKYLNGINKHGQLAKIIYEVSNGLEKWYYQILWEENTGRWIKIRNSDGTVAGVGKVTELPTGIWTETVLNDGKVLVNGYGFIYAQGQSVIEIPVMMKMNSINIQTTVYRAKNDYNNYVIGAEYSKSENKIYFTASFNNNRNNNLSYYWSCQGLKV